MWLRWVVVVGVVVCLIVVFLVCVLDVLFWGVDGVEVICIIECLIDLVVVGDVDFVVCEGYDFEMGEFVDWEGLFVEEFGRFVVEYWLD